MINAYLVQLSRSFTFLLTFFYSGTLYSNTLLDCCGLLTSQATQFANSVKERNSRQVKPFRPSPVVEKPRVINPVVRPTKKELAMERIAKAQMERQKQIFKPVRQPVVQFKETRQSTIQPKETRQSVVQAENKNKALIDCLKKKMGRTVNNAQVVPTAPAMFYYAPRMKSIRMSSPHNIEGWERSLGEEMRLNGRSKHTVDRLLARIQKYYEDPTIEASDYAPGNEGYQPNYETLKLAESRIRQSVESMAEFYKKSGNIEMDNSKLTNGGQMMKGKLAFINTQLDKIGKKRVSMEDLREIVGLKLNPPTIRPEIPMALPEAEQLEPVVQIPEIAQLVPNFKELEEINKIKPADNRLVEAKVEQLYQKFAKWLADNDKTFPSLEPEVDALTLSYFEQVNGELRKLGDFEKMQVFREKTLAYLDDILDDRGKDLNPGEVLPSVKDALRIEESDDPLFREKRPKAHNYVHLASLPGKVVSFNSVPDPIQLPGKKTPFDQNGNKRIFRVMDNLPGKVIH